MNLKPFRDYDEKDVINLFAIAAVTNKGSLVKVTTGWEASDELEMLGSAGAFAPANVISQRYGVNAKVTASEASDTGKPLGITLFDVKETDENGELLKFNPRKATEIGAVLPGQAVPIVTRGIFLMEGVEGTPVAGAYAYVGSASGAISANSASTVIVGSFLGAKDANNCVLVKLAL